MRKTSKNLSFFQNRLLLLTIFTFGLIIVTKLIFMPRQSATVNLISSAPAPTSSPCGAYIKEANFTGYCGQAYSNFSFVCSNHATKITLGGTSSCKTVDLWLAEAQSECDAFCVTTTPTPTPTPPPTKPPSPPPGTCVSSLSSTSYTSKSRACTQGTAQLGYFVCQDGYSGSVGDGLTCRATTQLESLAKSRCGSPHPCPSPTPRPSPTPLYSPPPIQ